MQDARKAEVAFQFQDLTYGLPKSSKVLCQSEFGVCYHYITKVSFFLESYHYDRDKKIKFTRHLIIEIYSTIRNKFFFFRDNNLFYTVE